VKRGLVVLDPAEIPPGELEQRVGAVQAELRSRELAAALVYADVYHSGDLGYLSNICLYWNEALLAVPAEGKPALLTKLSARVANWWRATSNLEDFRSGRVLAKLAGGFLAQQGPGGVGLVELDWWPDMLVTEVTEAAVGREVSDLGSVVRRRRQSPSASEQVLLRRASRLTAQAVGSALDGRLSNPERAGRAELTARMGGAEDVLVYCRSSTADADTVEVIAEYRGYWTGAARVLAAGAPGWTGPLAAGYQAAAAALTAGVTPAAVRDAGRAALAAFGPDAQVDLIQHTDLETDGGYRYQADLAAPLADGAVVTLRVELGLADGSAAVLADTYQAGAGTAACLTAAAAGPVISTGTPAAAEG
jgi:Xaa-Pro aminopeptidase